MAKRRRRFLLPLLSLASLLVLAYGGVVLAFSVPVDERMEAESRLPGADHPAHGDRALVLPLTGDPASIPTFAAGDPGWDERPGATLALSDNRPDFPASADNASLARALARVAPTPNGTYEPAQLVLRDVPATAPDGNATTLNLTLDVAALAGGATGWLVKPDGSGNVSFVPDERVLGTVAGYEDGGDVVLLLTLGAFGFVTPLVAFMLTHRPSGRPGIGQVACPECHGPMPAAADFCTRCGAWKPGKEPNPHARM